MTEQEMLEATRYIAKCQDEIGELRELLHQAGISAGKQAAAITKALQCIEQAHQALHAAVMLPDDEIAVLRHLANAMEALA